MGSTGLTPLRLILVEDDADVLEVFATMLRLDGHEVFEARHGREAIALALAERPHAAIVDIGLPDLDGHEVAREIRRQLGGDVILIALSGYGQQADLDQAVRAGFDVHLLKPTDADAVLHAVAAIARRLRTCPACGAALPLTLAEHLGACGGAARARQTQTARDP